MVAVVIYMILQILTGHSPTTLDLVFALNIVLVTGFITGGIHFSNKLGRLEEKTDNIGRTLKALSDFKKHLNYHK
ncbi:MAG: hypothetical protein MAG795_00026 [Candidatus Woesearchaeota archaeon]|nr:hypothetical protein [Candidatus Woesearchaeota archaeon]